MSKVRTWWAGAAIVVAVVVVYGACVRHPLVFDDHPTVRDNVSIRSWSPWWGPLAPQQGASAISRPLLNATLAVNWTLGGENPGGYHLVNLGIHAAAALLLWALLRRVLALAALPAEVRAWADTLAWFSALAWAVHPLTMIPVITVAQRAESLASLFYLAALYGMVRGAQAQEAAAPARRWFVLAVAACWLGVATKEIMATAPLLALVGDRLFLGGSWRQTWRRRGWWYAVLATCWIPLAALIVWGGNRDNTAGFTSWADAWDYLRVQPHALLTYLRLTWWPHPLVFDYGILPPPPWRQVVLPGAGVLLLLAATVWGVARGHRWSMAGAWFFLLLAPTSSVVPILTQTMSEHRMYLASAGLVTLTIVGGYVGLRRLGLGRTARRVGVAAAVALVLAWGGMAWERQRVFASEEGLWHDTAAKAPQNIRALAQVALTLANQGQYAQSIAQYHRLLEMIAAAPGAYYHENVSLYWFDLANTEMSAGALPQAIADYQTSIQCNPNVPNTWLNLGVAQHQAGLLEQARESFTHVLQMKPHSAAAQYSLANVLRDQGQSEAALAAYRRALELDPNLAQAANDMGNVLAGLERFPQAEQAYRAALRADPRSPLVWRNLGLTQASSGRLDEALTSLLQAQTLAPQNARLYLDIGLMLAQMGHGDDARRVWEQGLTMAQAQKDADLERRLRQYLAPTSAPAATHP